MKPRRVAIVHDWLVGGGAERVVEALHKIYPDAPIYTSYCTDEWRKRLDDKVVTGYLQHWPFSRLRKLLPILRIKWFESLKLGGYDLVISSSGAEAKGIKVPDDTLHVAYMHAPTHYYWSRYNEYMRNPGIRFVGPIAKLGLKILVKPLRKWDYKAAQRPDIIIANSRYIQSQIKNYYRRDSYVVHPPVDIERFKVDKPVKRSGFVIAGRQTPYKKIDLAVEACTKLNAELTVIGNGPEHKKLVKMAGSSIKFIRYASDQQIKEAFQSSKAFIFPGVDDFGIVAVEALAAECPVIAYKAGGALDYIKDNDTGILFDRQSPESLSSALKNFSNHSFNRKTLSKEAGKFSYDSFKSRFLEIITHANKKLQ